MIDCPDASISNIVSSDEYGVWCMIRLAMPNAFVGPFANSAANSFPLAKDCPFTTTSLIKPYSINNYYHF